MGILIETWISFRPWVIGLFKNTLSILLTSILGLPFSKEFHLLNVKATITQKKFQEEERFFFRQQVQKMNTWFWEIGVLIYCKILPFSGRIFFYKSVNNLI